MGLEHEPLHFFTNRWYGRRRLWHTSELTLTEVLQKKKNQHSPTGIQALFTGDLLGQFTFKALLIWFIRPFEEGSLPLGNEPINLPRFEEYQPRPDLVLPVSIPLPSIPVTRFYVHPYNPHNSDSPIRFDVLRSKGHRASVPPEVGHYRLDVTRLKNGGLDLTLELLGSYTFPARYTSVQYTSQGFVLASRHENPPGQSVLMVQETSAFHFNPSLLTLLYGSDGEGIAICRSSGRCFYKFQGRFFVEDFHYRPAFKSQGILKKYLPRWFQFG